MKPFHFPLESLRVLRQQKEQTAQQHYAKRLAACDQAAVQLQNAITELNTGWNLFARELEQGVAAVRLTQLQLWCRVLETRRNDRQTALAEACRVAELARLEMIAAARDREALDRFYEKSRRAHQRKAQQEEQKTLDELAVQLNGTPGPLQFTVHNRLN